MLARRDHAGQTWSLGTSDKCSADEREDHSAWARYGQVL